AEHRPRPPRRGWAGGAAPDTAAGRRWGGSAAPQTQPARPQSGDVARRYAYFLALAASLLVAAGAWLQLRPSTANEPVATLADSKACKWDGGTLPTEPGARLGAGRLRLAEGVARVVFGRGAEVNIE